MPWHEALGLVTAVFLAFAFVHSVCVTMRVKRLVARLLGERFVRGLYRFLYNVFSLLTTAIAAYLILRIPDVRLWSAPAWLRWPMHGIQLLGVAIVIRSFHIFDTSEFLGVRQAWRYLAGGEAKGDVEGIRINRLVTTGLYGLTRNPMYLGGILFFSFWPLVTRTSLAVSLLADAYFVFGALMEQRRMLELFGGEYRGYREEVPLIFPRPGPVLRAMKQMFSPGE